MEYKCNCGKVFEKKLSLAAHKSWCGKPKRIMGGAVKGVQLKEDLECPFCKQYFKTTKSGIEHHKMFCLENPDKRKSVWLGRNHTDAQKQKISEGMKKAHAEGRAGHWIRRVAEPSRPEQFLVEVLKNELQMEEGKDYKREVYFNGFFLDFVWEEKKLVIEMDGEQHQTLKEQVERDKRKDALLKAEGYKEMRIPWKECFHEPKAWIEKIKAFLK